MKQTIMVLALAALVVIVFSGCVHRPHKKVLPNPLMAKVHAVRVVAR